MLFVSDSHILCKFKGGKAVVIQINGIVIPQEPKLQSMLDQSESILSQSNIHYGHKFVLLMINFGNEDSEK